ncbi:hypothetical protein [Burkholderia territorii]|uniref:hypothetical protein n=1 Tax=Burkholderia territorii TaxID=1503055 RepID=UPI000A424B73|nr:hypothetical protein [Burkholderia territorii]
MTTSIACRRWLVAALAACGVFLSGCQQHKAYESLPSHEDEALKAFTREQSYDEAVAGFMITEDRTKLIVLGRPVHIALDLPDTLRSALSSDYRKTLRWMFVDFRALGGHVKGHYRVVLPRDASLSDRLAAIADGFVKVQDGVALEGNIVGMRYSTQDFDMPSAMTGQLLDRPYTIYARHVTMSILGLDLAMQRTPITAAADGTLAFDGTKLVPVELAVIQASRQ